MTKLGFPSSSVLPHQKPPKPPPRKKKEKKRKAHILPHAPSFLSFRMFFSKWRISPKMHDKAVLVLGLFLSHFSSLQLTSHLTSPFLESYPPVNWIVKSP